MKETRPVQDMNIHERRVREKAKTHTCRNCKSEIFRWIVDDVQNNYLTCFCFNCKTWNKYKYWGTCNDDTKPESYPLVNVVDNYTPLELELSSQVVDLKEKIVRLEFMIENGLGWEDMKNDYLIAKET